MKKRLNKIQLNKYGYKRANLKVKKGDNGWDVIHVESNRIVYKNISEKNRAKKIAWHVVWDTNWNAWYLPTGWDN